MLSGEEPGIETNVVPVAFRASSQMVLVPVTVTDHYGKTIEGLRAKDFKVLDGQVPRDILSFGSEDAPCSIGLVLDISGSMKSAHNVVKDTARELLGTTNPEDEFLLLAVSSQPVTFSGFTTNVRDLEKTIDFTQPGGMTALIDTVYLGLGSMRKARQPRRALLIISDGIDNHSRYSEREMLRIALEADVQIYTIILSTPGAASYAVPIRSSMIRKPGDHADERQGPEMLEKLSNKTGGLHFRARNAAEAKAAVLKIGLALRNQYVIGFQPSDIQPAGRWHPVRVKTTVQDVNVHARNGYYAH